jgi:galactokinase
VFKEARAQFNIKFGSEPAFVAMAPGRINLIGEHTDYNDGFVFPVAIDRFITVAAKPSDAATRLFSAQMNEGEPFLATEVEPGQLQGWAKYPAGMAWALRARGLEIRDIEAVVTSDLPVGSGVSSSAALEMAFGVIYREIAGASLSNAELAQVGKICENRFVGVNSGIMDQMASAMGREGQALFLDTRTLEIEYAPIPKGLGIVLCDTKKERALTNSAYNERRAQCEEAARVLGVKALRDATLGSLEDHRQEMSDVVYRRARHIVTENDRARTFKVALEVDDRCALGRLMRESHESLRDDYEVSCPELDWMAESAWEAPGCVGARMTGGGFGGACVALVEESRLGAFQEAALGGFIERGGSRGAEAMACQAVAGAHLCESG